MAVNKLSLIEILKNYTERMGNRAETPDSQMGPYRFSGFPGSVSGSTTDCVSSC